ncbi:hypothetical protein OU798_04740 [Prolixibacteraceae bacterium Z1-6]|uniref:Uncharacterized protein n=1 Tax=Draconibacterium aestuarii TaxID=2998507 RepID=A0A9X3F344_9BACT|nr:hypothetical protein [Prolixibacteraceae bacterium Z1-6]
MTSEFDSYRLYYHSAPQYSWQSRLYLYNNGAYVGCVFFMKEGVSIPANTEASGKPRLNFPASKFEEIMNMLRHEKPLYITLVPTNGIGTISTSSEPIGEEED